MNEKIIKGARVLTNGQGRTAGWFTRKGTVTRRKGDLVFVNWDSTHFVEDEMDIKEVKLA